MFDVALSSAGARILLATSHDSNHPPENMLDGDPRSFWMTSGMFPQQFILTFQSLMNVTHVTLVSSAVRRVQLERSIQEEAIDFERLEEVELASTDESGQLQKQISCGNVPVRNLRVTLLSGYHHFPSVHVINVKGTAAHSY